MDEQTVGTSAEDSSLLSEPGVGLVDLVDTDADHVGGGNNNVRGKEGSIEEWFWVNNDDSQIPGKGEPPVWYNQKAREKDEMRYRTLFENAGEAILVAEDGYIRFANQRMSDLLEVSYKEMLARKFTAFIHPDDREFVLNRQEELLRQPCLN